MHYLITGGAGFIGSHLADVLLSAGHDVTVMDDFSTGKRANLAAKINVIEADVANYPDLAGLFTKIDGCFHLAAVASVTKCMNNRALAHHTNVLATLHIFEAALAAKVPVVFASSSAVYGKNPNVPLAESEIPAPSSVYAADKLNCEVYARVFHQNYGLEITCLRFFNVYGPRQSMERNLDSGVIANFWHLLSEGKPVTIFGDGAQTRDFIYVADVVRILQQAMAQKEKTAAVYNVCTGQRCSIRNVLDTLANLLKHRPEINFEPAHVTDLPHSLGDPSLAKQSFDFTAEYSLQSGLEQLVAASTSR